MRAKLLQSCLTLCDMNCGLPGSSLHKVLQARILEWFAVLSFRGSSRPRDPTCTSCSSCLAGGFFTMSYWGSPCWGIPDIQIMSGSGMPRHALTVRYIAKWSPHSRNHLSPHRIVTVLLTVFPMLYVIFPWLTYFITGNLYLLIPVTYFIQSPPTSLLAATLFCSFICFVFRFHI